MLASRRLGLGQSLAAGRLRAPPPAGKSLVDAFNAGRGGDVFLLSTKAGGVGLNLVGANRLGCSNLTWDRCGSC